jgi:ABC-type polysaccharide/polyol phosphate export permease
VIEKYPNAKYMLLNPVAQIIQDFRNILVTPQATTTYEVLGFIGLATTNLLIIAILTFSIWFFRREAKYFAENV